MTPNINLLPKQQPKKTETYRKQGIGIFAIALCIILVGWQYISARSEMTRLLEKETQLLIEQSELHTQIELSQADKQSPLEVAALFVDNLVYEVSPLFDEIQSLQRDTMYLRSYEFGQKTVSLQLDFEMLQDVATFVTSLNNSAYFHDVKVGTIQQFQLETQNSSSVEELPRYSVELVLTIDQAYLATGGKQHE